MDLRSRLRTEIGTLPREVAAASRPLRDDHDLDPLLDRIGDARLVLLGEASHGTSEYYTFRSRISKRLIAEKGFSFIAVEGDWPACYELNRFVKGYDGSGSILQTLAAFRRWPSWMWANWEIVRLAEWLRERNLPRKAGEQAGFYGLDVYSLWESLEEIMRYLEDTDPEALQVARETYGPDEVVLVGFGSHRGTVMAGDAWGAPRQVMTLPEGKPGSWEAVFAEAGTAPALVLTDELTSTAAHAPRGHRAVGVVYHPQLEWGNYVPTVLPDRYDAFLHFDRTRALHPLDLDPAPGDRPHKPPCTMSSSRKSARWRVGCSGWQYDHWQGPFYPDDLPREDWFDHYTDTFGTATESRGPVRSAGILPFFLVTLLSF